MCFDGVKRLCHIRGKLRKRVWIGVGDIVLLGLREFQDQKADIILKYDGDEARSLKTYGELPETVQINAGTEMLEGEEFGDDNFDFDEDADGADSHGDLVRRHIVKRCRHGSRSVPHADFFRCALRPRAVVDSVCIATTCSL